MPQPRVLVPDADDHALILAALIVFDAMEDTTPNPRTSELIGELWDVKTHGAIENEPAVDTLVRERDPFAVVREVRHNIGDIVVIHGTHARCKDCPTVPDPHAT